MASLPVIAVLDVGKTNKKILLFNRQYQVVYEQTARLAETTDEDGFPCEDVHALRDWVRRSLQAAFEEKAFQIMAINAAAYGASLVYLDKAGELLTPLYNYLKPYPEPLQQELHEKHGGAEIFAVATASPVLGSLNSGRQLYRLKKEQPAVFDKIQIALHLPQYIGYLISGNPCSDLTSIGCHTALWDFEKGRYHDWVAEENLLPKLAPVQALPATTTTTIHDTICAVGVGLHDSSAALLPYRLQLPEPFVLISTGTWSISLNPFNNSALTAAELAQDCLCYLDVDGRPVKAARFFAGPLYEAGVARISSHFQQAGSRYQALAFDSVVAAAVQQKAAAWTFEKVDFADRDLALFQNDIAAYHYLMQDLVTQQAQSTNLVLTPAVTHLIVDGGFARNDVYMHLLAAQYPHQKVYAASMAQGTALGATLAIRTAWNSETLPDNLVTLKRYTALPHGT